PHHQFVMNPAVTVAPRIVLVHFALSASTTKLITPEVLSQLHGLPTPLQQPQHAFQQTRLLLQNWRDPIEKPPGYSHGEANAADEVRGRSRPGRHVLIVVELDRHSQHHLLSAFGHIKTAPKGRSLRRNCSSRLRIRSSMYRAPSSSPSRTALAISRCNASMTRLSPRRA